MFVILAFVNDPIENITENNIKKLKLMRNTDVNTAKIRMMLTMKECFINAWPGTGTSNSHIRKQNAACNADIKVKTLFKLHGNVMI